MVAIKNSARLVLLLLVAAIIAEFFGWFFGLVAITGSFPSASYKYESGLVLVCLFSALATLASGYKRLFRVSLVVVGALVFFGVAGLVIHIRAAAPLDVVMFWGLTNLIVVLMLGWLLALGYTTKAIDWRDLFISMACCCVGLLYFFLAK